MDTRELLEWAAKYHTPNYARAPICLVRGDGVRVWDSDGKEYLDFGAGLAVAALGHCHPRVTGAIREAAATLLHVSNLYYTAPQNHLRSEEHTSELQSRLHLVCRLLLEKKKKN